MAKNPLSHFVPGDFSSENYESIDLHKPFVDDWILVSPSGLPMRRESDLIDVWFDSGAMPFAQVHYPFENKEAIDEGTLFPADFIAEGVDQTRGWFFTLHTIAALTRGTIAYKNVISNGLVLDKNGQKMSKRLGNAVDPFAAMETHGADAVRWYLITNAQPWDNLKYDSEGVTEVQRKFFGTLYNTYGFFALYANVDGFDASIDPVVPVANRPEIDRWILSRLHSLVAEVTENLDAYEPTKAYRPVQDFVNDHLSNWYVRLCRRRFWKGTLGEDKRAAYHTLYTCLETIARLIAPLSPFYADRLFRDLTGGGSVHWTDFPTADTTAIDSALERRMELAQTITGLVLSIRKKVKIRVRQPLPRLVIPVLNAARAADLSAIQELLLSEVNVKQLEAVGEEAGVFTKKAKANFKTLGPKIGAQMKDAAAAIASLNAEALDTLSTTGEWILTLPSGAVTLQPEDVEISTEVTGGLEVATEKGITVALDIALTPELKREGLARELINRLQNVRKDSGLDITDRIRLWIQGDASVHEALAEHEITVASEVLASHIHRDVSSAPDHLPRHELDLEGVFAEVVLEKA